MGQDWTGTDRGGAWFLYALDGLDLLDGLDARLRWSDKVVQIGEGQCAREGHGGR